MSTTLAAANVSTDALPLISVSGLSSSNAARRQAVGAALREACLDKGFFYVTDHGIPAGLIDAVLREGESFFSQPMERKDMVNKAHSFCNRGYEPLRAQTLEAGAPPDLKESFYSGVELPLDDPRVIGRKFNHGPNQWPADLPSFRATLRAYFAAMLDLSERLMQGLALSLGMPEDSFAEFNRDPIAILRLLHYPPQPANAAPGEKGAGAHTDFGGLTILLQDQVGGLQVRDASTNQWLHAQPVPGAFIVNLGDMIARWTNDLYRSTMHRVVNESGRERYSVPFFFSGNPDYLVSCLPACLKDGEAPKYQPTTVENHLLGMYKRTYGK